MTEGNGWIACSEQLIPSETGAGKRVIDDVLSALHQHCWRENDVFGIHLAVEEAVVNAIKHGNQFDKDKKVRIVYRMAPDRFRIEITDEGNGFDPDEVPDPLADENLEIPSGRGLMLIRWFMSSVRYLGGGNHLVMEKERTP